MVGSVQGLAVHHELCEGCGMRSLAIATLVVLLLPFSGCSSWFMHPSCSEAGQEDVGRAADWLRGQSSGLEDLGAISDCDSGGVFAWMFRTDQSPNEFLSRLDGSVCTRVPRENRSECWLPASRVRFSVLFDVQFPQEADWHLEVGLIEE